MRARTPTIIIILSKFEEKSSKTAAILNLLHNIRKHPPEGALRGSVNLVESGALLRLKPSRRPIQVVRFNTK